MKKNGVKITNGGEVLAEFVVLLIDEAYFGSGGEIDFYIHLDDEGHATISYDGAPDELLYTREFEQMGWISYYANSIYEAAPMLGVDVEKLIQDTAEALDMDEDDVEFSDVLDFLEGESNYGDTKKARYDRFFETDDSIETRNEAKEVLQQYSHDILGTEFEYDKDEYHHKYESCAG